MDRRKILLVFVGAWIAAAVLVWVLYASTKTPRVEKTIAVLAAARDMPAGTRLRAGDLKTVNLREKDLPKAAIQDEKQALDHPLLFPVSTNEPITLTKIAGTTGLEGVSASIEVGKRAIAVAINDSSGVAGLIQPRAHVDVLFTRPGNLADAVTTTILEDVVVLAMGRNVEATSASTSPAAAAQATARPVTAQSATLLVTPAQARKLELAKNEGKISLALRNPLDHNPVEDDSATTADELYNGLARPKDTRSQSKVIVEKVEKKESPKPAKVVDVFRGEKHERDSFE